MDVYICIINRIIKFRARATMENYAAILRDAKQKKKLGKITHILIDHRLYFLSAYSIDPHTNDNRF